MTLVERMHTAELVKQSIQQLYRLLGYDARIRREYAEHEYAKFLSVFIPIGGIRIKVIIVHKKTSARVFYK